jgi:hypothetical protein
MASSCCFHGVFEHEMCRQFLRCVVIYLEALLDDLTLKVAQTFPGGNDKVFRDCLQSIQRWDSATVLAETRKLKKMSPGVVDAAYDFTYQKICEAYVQAKFQSPVTVPRFQAVPPVEDVLGPILSAFSVAFIQKNNPPDKLSTSEFTFLVAEVIRGALILKCAKFTCTEANLATLRATEKEEEEKEVQERERMAEKMEEMERRIKRIEWAVVQRGGGGGVSAAEEEGGEERRSRLTREALLEHDLQFSDDSVSHHPSVMQIPPTTG